MAETSTKAARVVRRGPYRAGLRKAVLRGAGAAASGGVHGAPGEQLAKAHARFRALAPP